MVLYHKCDIKWITFLSLLALSPITDYCIICSVISLAPRNTISLEGTLAVCLDCRESSYFHTTVLCVFSNIIGGFILLHFNCDSEVPAEGTGYTNYSSSIYILYIRG